MASMIARMLPRLIRNRIRWGRWVDVLITHAPPRDINDRDDVPHRGFRIMRRFLQWFRPAYHLHGHVHLYDRNEPSMTTFGATSVINVYPYRVLDLELDALCTARDSASRVEVTTS
jgi:Icc-related predicted phosphoesterase